MQSGKPLILHTLLVQNAELDEKEEEEEKESNG